MTVNKQVDSTTSFLAAPHYIRGLSIVCVVIIHATGPMISVAGSVSGCSLIYALFLNQISRFCVPAFLFISGYLYGRKYGSLPFDYKKFIIQRGYSILIPYVFWSFFYVSMKLATGELSVYQLDLPYSIRTLIMGDAYGHLYFIPLVLQFYILVPLFLNICKKTISTFSLVLFFFILSFFIICGKYYYPLLDLSFPLLPNCFFLWWLSFFAIGFFVGNRGDETVKFLTFHRILFVPIVFVLLVLMIWELYGYHFPGSFWAWFTVEKFSQFVDPGYHATFLRPSAYIYAIFTTLGLVAFFTSHKRNYRVLSRLGTCSFGIYFIHPFIMKGITKILKWFHLYAYDDYLPNIFMLTFSILISYFVVVFISKYKISYLFWGPIHFKR